eukprot:TRINITY_DN3727_c0_g1_i3.p1 TRINITY_DN3727_c0_g1~~TRINITY_DN3727_c0_g1_i3.p1  ORF type:complete len:294 (+),score=58.95 TRINITY_DN3727_c0_g1_i3:37-918(+)
MLRQRDKEMDIVFQAEENLLNQATGEIVLTKNSRKSIPVVLGERSFESYMNEFCGLTGLSPHTLRFQTEHRDINPYLIISSSCLVKVAHTSDFVASDYSSALAAMVTDSAGSDISIKIGCTMIPSYSYIVSARSPVLSKLIAEEKKESMVCIEGIEPENEKLAVEVFKWIHTGRLELPEDFFKMVEMMRLAASWQLPELAEKCEENITGRLSAENVLDLLVACGRVKEENVVSEETWNCAKSLFLKEFAYIQQLHADLEKRIADVPGLMSELFLHSLNAKGQKKDRHVRFFFE